MKLSAVLQPNRASDGDEGRARNDRVISKKSISAELADRLLEAARTKAVELGLAVAVAIVDESGIMKAFSRMDGAPLMAVGMALKKALAAVGYGLPTGAAWHDFIRTDPILIEGVRSINDFTMLGGGSPVKSAGEVIGAIGVSGGHYSQDEVCAAAALAVTQEP